MSHPLCHLHAGPAVSIPTRCLAASWPEHPIFGLSPHRACACVTHATCGMSCANCRGLQATWGRRPADTGRPRLSPAVLLLVRPPVPRASAPPVGNEGTRLEGCARLQSSQQGWGGTCAVPSADLSVTRASNSVAPRPVRMGPGFASDYPAHPPSMERKAPQCAPHLQQGCSEIRGSNPEAAGALREQSPARKQSTGQLFWL